MDDWFTTLNHGGETIFLRDPEVEKSLYQVDLVRCWKGCSSSKVYIGTILDSRTAQGPESSKPTCTTNHFWTTNDPSSSNQPPIGHVVMYHVFSSSSQPPLLRRRLRLLPPLQRHQPSPQSRQLLEVVGSTGVDEVDEVKRNMVTWRRGVLEDYFPLPAPTLPGHQFGDLKSVTGPFPTLRIERRPVGFGAGRKQGVNLHITMLRSECTPGTPGILGFDRASGLRSGGPNVPMAFPMNPNGLSMAGVGPSPP